MRGVWRFLFRAALGMAIVVGAVVGILRAFFVTPVTITDNGMAPTLLSGEQGYMWRGTAPELGKIMVCTHPSTGAAVIGRVIGMQGNTIEVEREQLVIGGRPPPMDLREAIRFFNTDLNREESVRLATVEFGNTDHDIFLGTDYVMRLQATTVQPGKVYLMGDHRADPLHDSRTFGPVDATTCLGSIFMRGRPVEATGLDHGWLDIL